MLPLYRYNIIVDKPLFGINLPFIVNAKGQKNCFKLNLGNYWIAKNGLQFMSQTTFPAHGMVSAPHHLAAKAGLRVLEDGGNAIEAMVAVEAAITVVYPDMSAIGGDDFWLTQNSDKVTAIDACGAADAAGFIKDKVVLCRITCLPVTKT